MPTLISKYTSHSSAGDLSKGWYSSGGRVWLVKGNSSVRDQIGFEPYSEVMACRIAYMLQLPHAYSELHDASEFPEINVYYPCKHVSATLSFASPEYSIIGFSDYLDSLYAGVTDYWEAATAILGKPYMYRLLVFDALIGNQDRHLNNFAILRYPNGKIVPAPIYDSGASLLAWSNKLSQPYSNDKSKPFRAKHETQIKLVVPPVFAIKDKELFYREMIDGIRDILALMPPRRAQAIIDYLRYRMKYLR